ncbi:MAG: hypothetical protein ISN29_05195 [Gammaproteobacteria bacterium AqS3]|nr:hypothetical protein [Gammaproteobacteria bacterium AqS3]
MAKLIKFLRRLGYVATSLIAGIALYAGLIAAMHLAGVPAEWQSPSVIGLVGLALALLLVRKRLKLPRIKMHRKAAEKESGNEKS